MLGNINLGATNTKCFSNFSLRANASLRMKEKTSNILRKFSQNCVEEKRYTSFCAWVQTSTSHPRSNLSLYHALGTLYHAQSISHVQINVTHVIRVTTLSHEIHVPYRTTKHDIHCPSIISTTLRARRHISVYAVEINGHTYNIAANSCIALAVNYDFTRIQHK